VLRLAWHRFSANWPVLAGAHLLIAAIGQAAVMAVNAAMRVPSYSARTLPPIGDFGGMMGELFGWRQVPGLAVSMALSAFFAVGIMRLSVEAARGGTPELGTLFMGGDRFLPMLGTYVLTNLAMGAGCCMLVVPGIVIGLGLFVTSFYVADGKLGPIEAMRASWAATRGHKGDLLILAITFIGMCLLGLVACCLPFFGAEALCWVAAAIIYLRLSGLGGADALPAEGS
jgi:hypothetical protein